MDSPTKGALMLQALRDSMRRGSMVAKLVIKNDLRKRRTGIDIFSKDSSRIQKKDDEITEIVGGPTLEELKKLDPSDQKLFKKLT